MNNKDTLFTRHKAYFSVTSAIQAICVLITLISIFLLPLGSYNLTKFDATKVTLAFNELSESNPLIILGFFFLILSVTPVFINKKIITDDKWKEKIKYMLIAAIAGVIFFIIGASICDSSLQVYTDPNSLKTISIKKEIGAKLCYIVIICPVINLSETILLKLILAGKFKEEQIFGKTDEHGNNYSDKTLSDK